MTTTTAPLPLPSAELAARRDDADLRIIDVRTPAEFETAHIPGSYNVPLQNLAEHRRELAEHLDETVVLVCQSGNRAREAEQRLAEAGMRNMHVLDGGMVAWQQTGGEVACGRQRWSLERQVRLVAGSLVFGSVLASAAIPGAKWLAGAVGGGLTFAALSNTCAMGTVLSKLPYNRQECDVAAVVAELLGDRNTAEERIGGRS